MACALTERIGPHPKFTLLGAVVQIQIMQSSPRCTRLSALPAVPSGCRMRFVFAVGRLLSRRCHNISSIPEAMSPSGHYTSERVTSPYSGELPASAFHLSGSLTAGKHCQVLPTLGFTRRVCAARPGIVGSDALSVSVTVLKQASHDATVDLATRSRSVVRDTPETKGLLLPCPTEFIPAGTAPRNQLGVSWRSETIAVWQFSPTTEIWLPRLCIGVAWTIHEWTR